MARFSQEISKKFGVSASILTAVGFASVASAATVLHFDINDVTITATPSTIADPYTGTVNLSLQTTPSAKTYLESIDIDGTDQTLTSNTVTALSGSLNLVAGNISPTPASTISFTIVDGSGTHNYSGTLYELDSEVAPSLEGSANSYLDSNTVAGVNVSEWAMQAGDSDIYVSSIPSSSNEPGNLEVYLYPVPEPTLGFIALIGLAATRIRNRRV